MGSEVRQHRIDARTYWQHMSLPFIFSGDQRVTGAPATRSHIRIHHQVSHMDRKSHYDVLHCSWFMLHRLLGYNTPNFTGKTIKTLTPKP